MCVFSEGECSSRRETVRKRLGWLDPFFLLFSFGLIYCSGEYKYIYTIFFLLLSTCIEKTRESRFY